MCHRGEGFGKTGSDRSTPQFFTLYRSKSIVSVHCKVYLFGGVCVLFCFFMSSFREPFDSAGERLQKVLFSNHWCITLDEVPL